MTSRYLVLCAALTGGCSPQPPAPLKLADMPAINTDAVLADIRRLSSDEFAGRGPGSKGEELTVSYLVERFKAAGAEPGNPDGTWTQTVPLVSITPSEMSPLSVRQGSRTTTFKQRDEVVAFSPRVTDRISLDQSEMVFVGYGVQAPEYQWDDFKGLDVKGKTLIVLVNDPPIPVDPARPDELDPKMFGGRAMTYYGRWTYKYDKAAELGAAAVFIVHETVPAGYGFNVVQGFGGERFDLVTPDKNMSRPAVQGWLSLEAATRLLKMASQDFGALKAKARTREFAPVRARRHGIDVLQSIDAAPRLTKRDRPDPGQRSRPQERVRDLHRPLGPPRHRATRSTATRSTTARATTPAGSRC